MKVVEETIGQTSVMVQMIDGDVEVIGVTREGPDIVDTGIEEKAKNAYTKAKAIIRGIAEDMGTELRNIQTNSRPKQMEIEFNMGLSAQAGVWIVGVQNNYALKVKITWEIEETHV